MGWLYRQLERFCCWIEAQFDRISAWNDRQIEKRIDPPKPKAEKQSRIAWGQAPNEKYGGAWLLVPISQHLQLETIAHRLMCAGRLYVWRDFVADYHTGYLKATYVPATPAEARDYDLGKELEAHRITVNPCGVWR